MGFWTEWQILADEVNWYTDALPGDEPGVYELATAGPRGGNLKIVYIGETGSLRRRLSRYGCSGSHLFLEIDEICGAGKSIFFRVHRKMTKEDARAVQDRMLRKFQYEWNKKYPGR